MSMAQYLAMFFAILAFGIKVVGLSEHGMRVAHARNLVQREF
jgi:hypothetical protein